MDAPDQVWHDDIEGRLLATDIALHCAARPGISKHLVPHTKKPVTVSCYGLFTCRWSC